MTKSDKCPNCGGNIEISSQGGICNFCGSKYIYNKDTGTTSTLSNKLELLDMYYKTRDFDSLKSTVNSILLVEPKNLKACFFHMFIKQYEGSSDAALYFINEFVPDTKDNDFSVQMLRILIEQDMLSLKHFENHDSKMWKFFERITEPTMMIRVEEEVEQYYSKSDSEKKTKQALKNKRLIANIFTIAISSILIIVIFPSLRGIDFYFLFFIYFAFLMLVYEKRKNDINVNFIILVIGLLLPGLIFLVINKIVMTISKLDGQSPKSR